jgi:hypothetical protein
MYDSAPPAFEFQSVTMSTRIRRVTFVEAGWVSRFARIPPRRARLRGCVFHLRAMPLFVDHLLLRPRKPAVPARTMDRPRDAEFVAAARLHSRPVV